MRHTHWWGAAAGAVALAGAAYVAPAAVAAGVAAPHKPRVATSAPQTGRYGKVTARSMPGTPPRSRPQAGPPRTSHGTSHGNGNGNGNGHHGKPPYPPGRTSAVSINVPSKVHRGKAVTVSTKVSVNNRALGGVKVALYSSRDGETWKLVATTTTRPNGTASFNYTVKRDTLVRIVVAGNRTSQASQSTVAKISVKH